MNCRDFSFACLFHPPLKEAALPGTILLEPFMTIGTLIHAIRDLSSRDRAKLFDKLRSSLEDYLLVKIAEDRFKRASKKRIPWANLRP